MILKNRWRPRKEDLKKNSMPNANYQKGRKKEYLIKKQLEREGFIVLRTAGSHGFADLVAIDKDARWIRFIQCKPDNFCAREKEKLLAEYLMFDYHLWHSTFEVI